MMNDCYNHAKELMGAKEYHEAYGWLRKAAEQGSGNAKLELILWYSRGGRRLLSELDEKMAGFEGISDAEAAGWCRDLAEVGLDWAQVLTGYLCCHGKDMEHDPVEAVKWWEKAAEKGNHRAMYLLGECYHDGRVVEKDGEKAIELLKEAVDYFLTADDDDGIIYVGVESTLDAEYIIACGSYDLGELYRERPNAGYGDLTNSYRYFCIAEDYDYGAEEEIDEVDVLRRTCALRGGEIDEFVSEMKGLPPDETVSRIEDMLKGSFGDTWGMLCKESRKCLMTGFYAMCSLEAIESRKDSMDYSSAIIPMVKACEIEFGIVFLTTIFSI